MKRLIISTDALKPALSKLGQVIPDKPALPALSNIFFRARKGEVELITSDLELTISYVCSCECVEPFEMLIPFDYLKKVVSRSASEPLQIILHDSNKGAIKGETDNYQIGVLDNVADFPKIPDVPKKNVFTLDASFMSWLDRGMATVSKDNARPSMTKALLEFGPAGITIVSTDAHSLFRHFFPMEIAATEQILISPKIAKALQDFEKTTLCWNAKHVALKADNITLIATRHNDKYPDYKVVIPNHGPNLELSRLSLMAGLKKAEISNSERVSFQFSKTGSPRFSIMATDEDLGRMSENSVEGKYTGSTEEISFAPHLLLTLLNQIPFDEIRMHIDKSGRAALISAEEDANYLGMIMPIYNP